MAMNPMQRRARNSFLTGMLVTLVIMAVVVVALLYKINQLNEDKEKLIAQHKTVYVAAADISSGDTITSDMLASETVISNVDPTTIFTMEDFMQFDDDGNELVVEYVSKVDLPAGTIITKDMVAEIDDQVTDDQRIQEYNMFSLPSELRNGQFIDIRLKLANGADYIVASKKKVLQCNSSTVWLKVSEAEILTIGCSIVDSYKSTGSKLYVTTYSEAGLQASAATTYTPNSDTWDNIQRNPNILQETKNLLLNRYTNEDQGNGRVKIDNSILDDPSVVQTGVQQEVSSMKTARDTFVQALEGTGEVGSSVPAN